MLINDLDLRITKDLDVYFPWKFDLNNLNLPAIKGDNIVDNVEKVELDNALGTYTIEITHKGNLVGGSQNYSLIVSGFDQQFLSNNEFTNTTISVYPNPTEDLLHVDSIDSILKYQLFDVQGRLMKSEKFNNQNNIDIDTNSLAQGVYVLNLTTEKGILIEKIVKK